MKSIKSKILHFKNKHALSKSIKAIEKHLEITEELKGADSKQTWVSANNAQIIHLKQSLKILKERQSRYYPSE